ncbi:hypothetical protein GGR50DRAFT_321925 [Xylaria sp. CBS 124048]|nr:hypothetical protein GGR50DRAFT_321925 [Xylaria sp. CBS 124048]
MADARALLRARRAENRIRHPNAAYSASGRLFCKLCQGPVKSESLWDTHIRSQIHRQRLQSIQQQQSLPVQASADSTHKRKRSKDGDEPTSDAGPDLETARAKRNKTDLAAGDVENEVEAGRDGEKEQEKAIHTTLSETRRPSGTPVQGIGIAIPSRPATPLTTSNSTVSTPKVTSVGRSPLVGSDGSPMLHQPPPISMPMSIDATTVPAGNISHAPSTSNHTTDTQPQSGTVNEAEWAAFEAEMSALDAAAPPSMANSAGDPHHLFADRVISAPALTTAQLAAKSQEEANERMKQAAEAEIANEREDATRALEAEFEEMEELEGRVRRLKERREQLRKESVISLHNAVDMVGKENLALVPGGEEEEEEDDDDEEDDDWDGFRFRP